MWVKVTFVEDDGTVHEGLAREGDSLMRAAQVLDVPGILAECGGMCACSTCHCYVDAAWADRLAPISDMEEDMLEAVLDPTGDSRLSCQIPVTGALDGIVVRVPARQG